MASQRIRQTIAVVLLLTGGSALAAPSLPEAAKGTRVVVDAVRFVVSDETMPVLGRLVALRHGPVASEVAGVVRNVRAEVGTRVVAGAPLVEVDDEPLRLLAEAALAQQAARDAELAEARASARIAANEVARLEALRNSAAFTPSRLEDKTQESARAESAVVAAAAALRLAAANRRLAERDLTRAVIRAPYAGVVTERTAEIGAYVAKGQTVAMMTGDSDYEIEAEIPADLLAAEALPQRRILVAVGETGGIATHIRALLPRENPRTRTRTARLTLAKPAVLPPSAAAEQAVRIAFPAAGRKPALTVAKDAVIVREGRSVVMVAASGRAEERPVELGRTLGERFLVVSGLVEGDLAIVRGNERLMPGTALRIEEPR